MGFVVLGFFFYQRTSEFSLKVLASELGLRDFHCSSEVGWPGSGVPRGRFGGKEYTGEVIPGSTRKGSGM